MELFLKKKETPKVHVKTPLPNLDMKAFSAWCQELNVGTLANKNSEFTVTIGDRTKYVKLERF